MDKTLRKMIKEIGTYDAVANKLGVSVRTLKRYVYGESKIPHNLIKNLINIKEGRTVNLTSTDKTEENVRELIDRLGGIEYVASVFGKTYQAIWKWYKGKSKPDEANWYLMKQLVEEKGKVI